LRSTKLAIDISDQLSFFGENLSLFDSAQLHRLTEDVHPEAIN
jgi:hypothetical protein